MLEEFGENERSHLCQIRLERMLAEIVEQSSLDLLLVFWVTSYDTKSESRLPSVEEREGTHGRWTRQELVAARSDP